jgi:exonuclease SbcC
VRLRRIRVHNFKCFKDAELNLRDVETIIVVGANGAGKSTLVIDALTWCLYGHTALTDLRGYRQDDLVRIGTNECAVEVEFELSGDTYVVRRTFNISKKGSSLEIFVNKRRLDMKIRDAERFLCERIGLDYEGFVNSTIIRQEEMKRLISEDPSKRKDIFISLFRLGIYEEALQKTKEKRIEAEKKLSEVKGKLSGMEALIGQERDWKSKLTEINPRIKEAEEVKAQAEQALGSIKAVLPELEEKANKLALKESKHTDMNDRIRRNQERLGDNASNLSQLEEQVKQLAEKAIVADAVRNNYEKMFAMKDEYSEVTHEKEMIEQLTKVRVEQEQTEIKQMEQERDLLLDEKKSILSETDKERVGLIMPSLVKKHRESIDKLEECAIDVGRAERDVEIRKTANLDSKKLTESKKSESRKKLNAQRTVVDETLTNLVTELPRLSTTETKLAAIEQRIIEAKKKLSERCDLLSDGRITVGNVEGRGLITLNDARALISELHSKSSHIIDSGYDPRAIEGLKRELDEANGAKEGLIEAKAKVVATKSVFDSLTRETSLLVRDALEIEEEINASKGIKDEYQNAKERISSLQNECLKLSSDVEGLRKQRDEVEANLRNIETYKATLRDLEKEQKEAERDISYYRQLESVFHRDGIPSSILKRIIPRVASESSSLLAELSNGRYDAVTIEEQEDGKLNIWVKDGEEKYGVHRFSGGEKVRIALAVRLAVSKVLSELPEAGKRLSRMKTLIIDEGDLGSLDGEGLNSTIEIINSLTKLFGLTILISHLDAVKGWVGGNYVTIQRGERGTSSTIEYA